MLKMNNTYVLHVYIPGLGYQKLKMATLHCLRFIEPADNLRGFYLYEGNSMVQSVSEKITLCKNSAKKFVLFNLS